MEGATPEYRHGFEAGEMHARLESHDRQFSRVNGNLERMTESIGGLAATLTRLKAEVATRETVTLAVKEALYGRSKADDEAEDRTWSRRERWLGGLLALVTVGNLLITVVRA